MVAVAELLYVILEFYVVDNDLIVAYLINILEILFHCEVR